MSSEERFWQWFRQNSDRLFRFESDQERILDELESALAQVKEGLMFEFGPIEGGKRVFVVSADGVREHFEVVRSLVAVAPAMPGWEIVPFRPPASVDLVVNYGGHSLGPDDVLFQAEPDRGRIGLTLFIKGLTTETKDALCTASFILLDNALGEFVVETQVGFIERKPLSEATPDARPFRSITEVFDGCVQ
mgnify:CR=1 FL=1